MIGKLSERLAVVVENELRDVNYFSAKDVKAILRGYEGLVSQVLGVLRKRGKIRKWSNKKWVWNE